MLVSGDRFRRSRPPTLDTSSHRNLDAHGIVDDLTVDRRVRVQEMMVQIL